MHTRCVRPRLAYACGAMSSSRADRGARAAAVAIGAVGIGAMAFACLPGAGPPINAYVDDAGPPGSVTLGNEGGLLGDVDLGDPFAITGLQPSHGPWTGGTRTTIAGRGFSSSIQVWIGGTLLDSSAVFASDPTRISVLTPPGSPGPADVRIRNVASAQERTMLAGFYYDSLEVSPSSGATTGGTRIAVQGSATQWTAASTVLVGGQPCTALVFTDATDLSCATPPGSPGAQDVSVSNADGSVDLARDAFTYSDSPDGYRGGLYGGVLSGTLTVLGFDSWTGTPLAGGKAIAGSNVATAVVGTFNTTGVVSLNAPSLTGKVTVTVAAKCHQPVTFVDVPVDTVTAYLVPELDPSCGTGDPPSSGNYYGTKYGSITGELDWTGGVEFNRSGWTNIPSPGPNERQAAYVFVTTTDPAQGFQLPSADSATTPDSSGQRGYAFSIPAPPGNQDIYALAGLEDRTVSPPRFEPYAMGIARGVLVSPGMSTDNIAIPMTTVLDHALDTVPHLPSASQRGPDRLITALAIDVGSGQFAILPQGIVTTLLPVSGGVSFVGVPALDGTLAGASYDLTAAAVTGASEQLPISAIRGIEVTTTDDPVTVGGFLAIPTLQQPSAGAWSGTHVALQAGQTVDLAVLNVSSGNGLMNWTIVAPGSDLSFDLPDLSAVTGVTSLIRGPIATTFSVARIDSFDYTRLRYGQLTSGAWRAYAQDSTGGSY